LITFLQSLVATWWSSSVKPGPAPYHPNLVCSIQSRNQKKTSGNSLANNIVPTLMQTDIKEELIHNWPPKTERLSFLPEPSEAFLYGIHMSMCNSMTIFLEYAFIHLYSTIGQSHDKKIIISLNKNDYPNSNT
jgi:hypothetical protein